LPRTARIGETRPARRAGQNAPSKVTTMPIAAAVMAALALTSRVPTGTSLPRIGEIRPDASPRPSASPNTVPATPITSASVSTEPVAIRGDAPSVRSMPSSRMRWSTVMLKLFRIRKPPTNSATPEKK
jgi:hypothetical protein